MYMYKHHFFFIGDIISKRHRTRSDSRQRRQRRGAKSCSSRSARRCGLQEAASLRYREPPEQRACESNCLLALVSRLNPMRLWYVHGPKSPFFIPSVYTGHGRRPYARIEACVRHTPCWRTASWQAFRRHLGWIGAKHSDAGLCCDQTGVLLIRGDARDELHAQESFFLQSVHAGRGAGEALFAAQEANTNKRMPLEAIDPRLARRWVTLQYWMWHGAT